jgi:hypothetical protein
MHGTNIFFYFVGQCNAFEEMQLEFVVNAASSDESDVEWDIEAEDVTEIMIILLLTKCDCFGIILIHDNIID